MLHTFQLGICIYVLEGLFSEKKARVVAQKKGSKYLDKVKGTAGI
jgi:hypothetical protein